MQVGTEEMPKDILRISERLHQFSQQTLRPDSSITRIMITEEDHVCLAIDLKKLDHFLYLTDVKESLYFKSKFPVQTPKYCLIPLTSKDS